MPINYEMLKYIYRPSELSCMMQKLNYDDVLFMTTSDLMPVRRYSEASCVDDYSCLLNCQVYSTFSSVK